ncbi:helix-turn-helix domain-containing protein [Clostridium baratii]|uniref:helix-turn-helix domain-containing protein n=1 Tax=Clostridium baratii TaxID=1561 RepID=UPI0030CAF6C2
MRNSNAQSNPGYYAIIPANVRYDLELRDKAKLLYGEITSLTNCLGYCYATNKYFATLYGVKKETISRLISELVDKGYLQIQLIKENDVIVERRLYVNGADIDTEKSIPIDKKINTGIDEKVKRGIDKKINRGIDEKVKENNTSINIININNIYSHFNSKNIIKSRKLTSKLEKLIQNKLKDYSEKEIIKAIDNYAMVVSDESYYFDTKWNLEKFLKQSNAMPDFLDDGVKWINYIERTKGGGDNGETRRNNGVCSTRSNIGTGRNNKNRSGAFSSKVKSEEELTAEERAAREELE